MDVTEHAETISRENATILNTDALIKHAIEHCESCCRIANYFAQIGDNVSSRHWSDRAQNLRRVLVDYDALPQASL